MTVGGLGAALGMGGSARMRRRRWVSDEREEGAREEVQKGRGTKQGQWCWWNVEQRRRSATDIGSSIVIAALHGHTILFYCKPSLLYEATIIVVILRQHTATSGIRAGAVPHHSGGYNSIGSLLYRQLHQIFGIHCTQQGFHHVDYNSNECIVRIGYREAIDPFGKFFKLPTSPLAEALAKRTTDN